MRRGGHFSRDQKNFDRLVMEEKRTALVDFWSPRCGPCRMLGPVNNKAVSDSATLLPDCVKVARQTLTLFVWVRILVGQPARWPPALHLDEKNFQHLVLEEKTTALVDFWSPHCGPCRMLGPILDKVADEVPEGTLVAKVNTDEEGELARKYGVMYIPTLDAMRINPHGIKCLWTF